MVHVCVELQHERRGMTTSLFTKLNSMKIVQLSDNVDKVHYLQSLYIVSINYNVLILLMLLVRRKEDSFNHGYQSSNI